MNQFLRSVTPNCRDVAKKHSKTLKGCFKVFLLLCLFTGVVSHGTFAQNCADVTGPDKLCKGASIQTYTAVSICDASTYVWSVTNDATSSATTVGSVTGPTVTVNPGATTGTFTVIVQATSTDPNDAGAMATGSRSTAVRQVTLSLTQQAVTCFGGSNGSVTATFGSGFFPYQIRIDGGAYAVHTSPFTFTGLSGGNHTVDVLDANTCFNSKSIAVLQPLTALDATDAHTDVLCNGSTDGTVTLTFGGGTGPYTVSFNGGAFAAQTSPKTYSGLSAGTYAWIVKDANGCTQSGSEVVGQPTAIVATDTHTDAACNGGTDGTVTLTFGGGTAPYTVSFNGGAFAAQTSPKTYSGLGAGTYTWIVKDANGCTQSGSEDIGQPTAVVATDAHTDVTCNGNNDGTVTLTFSGGTAPYTVSFNGGAFAAQTSPKTYSGLIAGTYSWIVKDAHGCTQSGSEAVGQSPAVVATDAHTDAACNGGTDGTVTLTFSGGTAPYTVSFNGGTFAAQTSPKTYSGL